MVHRNVHAIRLRDYVHQGLGHFRQAASSISPRSRASATTLAAQVGVQDRKVGPLSHWIYESIAACDHSAYHSVSPLIGAFGEDIPYAQVQGRIIPTLIGEAL
jgi:hypothetical protein